MKNFKDKINVEKVNDMISVGDRILKILYGLLIVVAIYIASLIVKEWSIFPIILNVLKVISPLFIGWIIAWLLNPLVVMLTKKGLSRTLSVILIFFSLLIIIYLLLLALIPSLTVQINDIVSSIPGIIKSSKDWIDGLFLNISNTSLVNLDSIKEEFFLIIENFGSSVAVNLPSTILSIVQGLLSGIGTIALSFIVGFYMLFNFHNLRKQVTLLFPKSKRDTFNELLSDLDDCLHDYINGTVIVSAILFVVSLIGFAIIGLKAPVLFALFCVITNLIPYIGPYIGGAAAALVGFTQSSLVGIVVIVFVVVIQLLESNILQPLVMSKKMNLHPVSILVSLLVFGYFFGIVGMVVCTPCVAVLKILFKYIDRRFHFFGYIKEEEKK